MTALLARRLAAAVFRPAGLRATFELALCVVWVGFFEAAFLAAALEVWPEVDVFAATAGTLKLAAKKASTAARTRGVLLNELSGACNDPRAMLENETILAGR